MTRRRLLAALAVACASACLGAGWALLGRWAGVAAVLGCAAGWSIALAFRAGGLPALCLTVSVALAVAGVLAGAPSWLMGLGLAAALAAWDLVNFDRAGGHHARDGGGRRLEAEHLLALVGGIAPGTALAWLVGQARLEIPFAAMAALVLVALWALFRLLRSAA